MTKVVFSWPKGKEGALTTSWDDGTIHDRRLVALFNKHGIKSTWNLNSGIFDSSRKDRFKENFNKAIYGSAAKNSNKSFLTATEIARLFKGHEVAVHTEDHPHLWRCPDEMIFSEVVKDRLTLEKLTGYPVRGMAFPCADTNDKRVNNVLKRAGILYSRSDKNSGNFELPADFLCWTGTCHQSADFVELWTKFLADKNPEKLFYLWGHSFEFAKENNWARMEDFGKLTGKNPKIWYATNMEIYNYASAWRSLSCSVDMSSVENKSAETVWFKTDNKLKKLKPGEIVKI